MTRTVKYIDLSRQYARLRREIFTELEAVFDTGEFILGPRVNQFEERFARYLSARHCIAVGSGTAALALSLRVLGIGPGDEVIVPANSFVATAGAVYEIGAKCLFADAADDMNLEPSEIERLTGPKTKAVIAVHLTGRPAPMTQITARAQSRGLFVIEDCAQAAGAAIGDQKVGILGDLGCFSFHPLKTLNSAGDGGAVVTNSDERAEKLRSLRNHGLTDRDRVQYWGANSRLDELQAAVLLVNLRYFEDWTETRIRYARRYNESLADIVRVPAPAGDSRCVYHTYVIRAEARDQLKDHLARAQIETKIHYPVPLHRQKPAGNQPPLTNCQRQAQRILSLPVHQHLTADDIDYVIENIKSFYR
ncbi:MAG: hypothetical protein AMJ79_07265 [Phycisphaerae bacterium SM23_30]|nr:MAG: hypothetical protein AMJ79_07265 [Phycisphaerae bacterium SM23_30]